MSASREERLDEIIGLACDAGRLHSEYLAADLRVCASLDRPRARRHARDLLKKYTTVERLLTKQRRRFLQDFPDV